MGVQQLFPHFFPQIFLPRHFSYHAFIPHFINNPKTQQIYENDEISNDFFH